MYVSAITFKKLWDTPDYITKTACLIQALHIFKCGYQFPGQTGLVTL